MSVARLETLMGSAGSSTDLIVLDLYPVGTVVAHGPDGFWSAVEVG